ncbi:hypothetical protein [Stenotrophomonas maltophilia]|uniref:hypothetical protein n=1 Tax=Stenotrophomonas maltophilia TaxID=40324 RepID=UPI0039F67A94
MSAKKAVRKGAGAAAEARLYSMEQITQAFRLPAMEVGVKVAGSDSRVSNMARRLVGEVFSQKQSLPANAALI